MKSWHAFGKSTSLTSTAKPAATKAHPCCNTCIPGPLGHLQCSNPCCTSNIGHCIHTCFSPGDAEGQGGTVRRRPLVQPVVNLVAVIEENDEGELEDPVDEITLDVVEDNTTVHQVYPASFVDPSLPVGELDEICLTFQAFLDLACTFSGRIILISQWMSGLRTAVFSRPRQGESSGLKSITLVLHDCLHAPDTPINLLSVRAFTERGMPICLESMDLPQFVFLKTIRLFQVNLSE
ncbi:hypothetical protein C8J56DRAFT_1054127 [Mycena floridula]|nr:hypothetical protein C8J56DRAFT_1054127 [Mycena floridula]